MSKVEAVAAQIGSATLVLRGHRMMLDADLARLYGVPTKAINQAVKRNSERFPVDFMFQLTAAERAQVVTFCDHLAGLKFSRAAPFAFTEQGVAMLSSVLKSPHAIAVNIEIMRTFVRLRRLLASSKELARRLEELETATDARFREVFEAIWQLMTPPAPPKRPIGFVTPAEKPASDKSARRR